MAVASPFVSFGGGGSFFSVRCGRERRALSPASGSITADDEQPASAKEQ